MWAAASLAALSACAPTTTDTAAGWGPSPGPLDRLLTDSVAPALPPTAPGLDHPDAAEAHARDLQSAVLQPPMEEWPIVWNDERTRLTAHYLSAHKSRPLPDNPTPAQLDALTTMDPQMVVVHWTAGGSARSAYNTFRPVRQRGQRIQTEWNAVNLAAHFVVDRDGTIFRLMPETRVGRHTIGLNHLAVGIENVGDGDTLPLTQAQLEANEALVRWLHAEHGLTHVIGHFEYRDFEGHPYFVERFDWFRTARADPGADFMDDLRARLSDLDLQGAPQGDG